MRARNYHKMSNISKAVNILGDTITITVRMRRVSFERADLLGPLVGRSVGITRLRNIQHTSTNETIPFYKTLPNIQYICTLLQMKPSLFYVSLSLPYKHILHDMAYFHWWNNPQSVLKLSHTSADRNIEWDQEYSNTGQKSNREKCLSLWCDQNILQFTLLICVSRY